MSKSGIILRLIDVVFILLFAFIAVSQVDSTMAVDPPKSAESGPFKNDSTRVITVCVLNNGTYPINDGQLVLEDSLRLSQYLSEIAANAEKTGRAIGIRIRANWDSPIEYSLAAANICRSLGLSKGLDVTGIGPAGR
ncbi:MAG: biopolymer transporter ExbD [candidate division KSB1 bacterium]|nr:biopolymer transporter ExbD [candidate division KSB1 bacterium]MDZ7303050.1 biopolymer transporter ExbD [candidate division KSB1 bacterium]MDZ7312442.1 biopolymer transporter ExbD [candidate division KSB1 bacterium]